MTYPQVLNESATLDLILSGRSIARYGDGELKMAVRPVGIKSQEHHPKLQRRLAEILHKSGDCLVGIPNILSPTPKIAFWQSFMVYAQFLADRPYVSSFITRPDSAPWIDTEDYWERFRSLWRGQAITLVRGSTKSFTAERLIEWGAGDVTEIVAPRQHAFAEYDRLLDRIGTPKRALLCLGPTATVMAVDLCARGVHAIDAGHSAMFYKKRVAGEAMEVTAADRVAV